MIQSIDIKAAILMLVTARGKGKSICPSEVARFVGGQDETIWRPLMTSVRIEAVKLAQQGVVNIKQGGAIVDPAKFTGIYRITMNMDYDDSPAHQSA